MEEFELPASVDWAIKIFTLGLIAYITFFWIVGESMQRDEKNVIKWHPWILGADGIVVCGGFWALVKGFQDPYGDQFLYLLTCSLIAAISFYPVARRFTRIFINCRPELIKWIRFFSGFSVGLTLLPIWLSIYGDFDDHFTFIDPDGFADFISWPILSAISTLIAVKSKSAVNRIYASSAAFTFFLLTIGVYAIHFTR